MLFLKKKCIILNLFFKCGNPIFGRTGGGGEVRLVRRAAIFQLGGEGAY